MTVYQRIETLGIRLIAPPSPIGNFVNYVRSGNFLYLSGQGPCGEDGCLKTGKVGVTVDVESAYQHARLTGLNLISIMQEALGDLNRVQRIVKILGMVNTTPEFKEHSAVINGCSDLFLEVFEDMGRHARSAIGMASLPGNISVEIEAVIEIRD